MVLFSKLIEKDEKREERKNIFFEEDALDSLAQHFTTLHRH